MEDISRSRLGAADGSLVISLGFCGNVCGFFHFSLGSHPLSVILRLAAQKDFASLGRCCDVYSCLQLAGVGDPPFRVDHFTFSRVAHRVNDCPPSIEPPKL
jgi:hypothetical protein